MQEALSSMAMAQAELQAAEEELEHRFLEAGASLESLTTLSEQFVSGSEKLIALATGQDTGGVSFAKPLTLLENAIDALGRSQEQAWEIILSLREHSAGIERLLRTQAELERTLLPLRFIKTMFRIEAAALDSAAQQKFVFLSQEIQHLHQQVCEIFGSKFRQLEEAQRVILQVLARSEREMDALIKATSARREKIAQSLEILRKELAANRERDIRLAALSREIAAQVQKVVIGLQFQDIVHQKLQHVNEALPQLGEACRTAARSWSFAEASSALSFVKQGCRLQTAQIRGTQDDLSHGQRTARESVEQILAALAEADQESLGLTEFKVLTTSCDGMIQVLIDSITEVSASVAGSVRNVTSVFEALSPLGSLASGLTNVVREMAAEIRLIGLNAQILAARVQQGTGLEVLSARTSDLSRETNRLNEGAAAELDGLVRGIAASVKQLEELRSIGSSHEAAINESGREEIDGLHKFRDATLALLPAIDESLQSIRLAGNAFLESAKFDEALDPALSAYLPPFELLAELSAKQLESFDMPEKTAADVTALAQGYSMASERRVLEQLGDGTFPSAGDDATTTSEPTDTGAELFVDTAAPAAPELFLPENETEQPTARAAAPVGQTDLGENVELF